MSNDLDLIPWHTLSHAYGAATDTPQHLRNLTNPDPVVSKQAHSALSMSIVHQGWVSEAAIAAFPYLLRLSLTSSGPTRSYAAVLAMIIIEGIAPPHLSTIPCGYFLTANGQMEDDPDAAAARTILYPLVIQNFPALLPLLHDPDETIAARMLHIIACCVTTDETVWSQIAPYVQTEQRPTFQASYQVIAWRSGNPMARAWVAETFVQSQEPLVKLTAALVLAHTTQPVPDVVTSWLVTISQANNQTLIKQYNALRLTRWYWFDCALVLYHRPLTERTMIVRRWLIHFDSRGLSVNDAEGIALLMMAFGRLYYKKSAVEHGDIQATVMLWLAQRAFTRADRDHGVPERVLRAFGLPWKPAAINGFLRLPNATHPAFATE